MSALRALPLRQTGNDVARPVQADRLGTAPVLSLALKEDAGRCFVSDFPALRAVAGLDEHVGFDRVGSLVIDETKPRFHEHRLSAVRHVVVPLKNSHGEETSEPCPASTPIMGKFGAEIKYLASELGASYLVVPAFNSRGNLAVPNRRRANAPESTSPRGSGALIHSTA